MAVIIMESFRTVEELMNRISTMNSDNSVCQFRIPGKGKFTLVLQEETQISIKNDVENNPELKAMIQESREQYQLGHGMSGSELIDSLSPEDFK